MLPASSCGHGVDGEIAPPQIVFELHVRRELGGEAAIAGADLALQARERVFFLGFRVQEHRESRGRRECNPRAPSSAGVAPTTTQSRSDTSRPSSRSRTAPPTKYTCMARMLTIRTALVLTACLALAGCGTTYVAQAAKGQLQILTARKPIKRVLADPAADARAQAAPRGGAARRASSPRASSGCLTTRATPSYADLKRDFVVWSVVATPEFSVEPREWCFPIVGCVAYRGYFRKDSAEAFAETLRSEGFDTMVGGVPAYSTLGKFNDPILNTMMSYGDDELASIMFHELSHQLVYIQDDTSFNEAFAVTVEQEGLARWLKFRGREADLAQVSEAA